MKESRTILAIQATDAADFRAQLDEAIAEVRGVAVLPPERDGDPDALLRALLDAAEDVIARRAVLQSAHQPD